MPEYDVIGLGNTTLDFLAVVNELPTMEAGAHMADFAVQGGGVIATAMVAAARLGMRVAHADAIGDDWVGKLVLQGLEEERVGTEFLQIVPGASTSACVVLVHRETGKRSFLCHPGTARREAKLPARLPEAIRRAKALHVGDPARAITLEAGRIAHEAGTFITVDTGDNSPRAFEFFGITDTLIANEAWPRGLSEDGDVVSAMQKARQAGTKTVVVTLGERGCIALDGDEVLEIPAFDNVPIVDTTGAGDVFHGAYVTAWVEGWDLPSRLRYASAVSAIKCGKLGGRTGIPTRAQLDEFLKDRGVTLTRDD